MNWTFNTYRYGIFICLLSGIFAPANASTNTNADASTNPNPDATTLPNVEVDASSVNPATEFRRQGKVKIEKYNHDFGTVKRGEKLSTKFGFVNIGNGSLKITGVHAACGCMTSQYDPEKIYLQGERGEIEIKFDTTNFKGKIQKIVSLIFNEAPPQTINLNISVNIEEEIYAQPPIVDFGDVDASVGASKDVVIKTPNKAAQIEKIICNEAFLQCNLKEQIPGGSERHLTVTLKKNLKANFFKGSITVVNTSNYLKELPIWVRANLKGSFEFNPVYIEFGAIAKQETSTKKIQLKKLGAHEIISAKAEININGNKASEEDVGKMVNVSLPEKGEVGNTVSVALKNSLAGLGSVHGKIILATNDPNQEQVTVDFYAFFR